MADVVTEPAPAKINAFLRVLGRRDDGYHDIETLIFPITLADGVQVVLDDELSLTITGDLAAEAPQGDDNLVLRAARALSDRVGEQRGARILLSKKVPIGAGLGGGSADAAAVLRALDALWGCGLGVEGLLETATKVGSDVPALVPRGPVMARGRGERVEHVDLPKTWWVLVTQPFEVSSSDAYGWWDESGVTGPDATDLVGALANGDLDGAAILLSNDLEPPVRERHPEIAEARRALLDAGALGAIMSGSGPTVAGLARDAAHAESLARSVGGTTAATISSS